MTYTKENLRQIFQQSFDAHKWQDVLLHCFQATELKAVPEYIDSSTNEEKGYYLGAIDTTDSYRIGLFCYDITNGKVAKKRVGLRNLVKSFINPKWGEFDAALVVFDSHDAWRLSFVCDIKGEATSPKRYTFVFGEAGNIYRTAIERFLMLQNKGVTFETLKEAFSVEALTKQFYNELFEWYQWAVSPEANVTFPNDTTTEDDDRENIDTKIIRLITRIMFVWFIKQKQLVPNCIFDETHLKDILKNFDPQSETEGNYYNAILQNLFFATLNRAIEDEQGNKRRFSKLKGHRDIKNLYRYADLFSISEDDVIKMFANVPFLNGGLFECQDKTVSLNGVEKAYNYDGFSRNEKCFADGRYKYRAVIPNALFFKPEYGLFDILNRYNFTIEENSPNEQQVALDPELLGKVFENLLGAYNPETKETARNQSGSFYTPREIVNYMVDESLKAYLGDTDIVNELLCDDFRKDDALTDEYNTLAAKIKAIKILDPACGSGAFPMGLLNRMVDMLQKISPEENVYNLKLSIIENCIYGSDIQSIAAQISKLRFFISLICDCTPDKTKPNFGIPTLPNLETKFVCANSLIGLKKNDGGLVNLVIEEKKQELQEVRHQHFNARTANQKATLREKDEQLRNELAKMLEEDAYFASEESKQIVAWNPYDQNAVSPFFDPEWMFGVKKFDIVIGNPPYIQLQNNSGELAELYADCNYSTFARTGDIYCLFYERGWQLLKDGGHLCYITSNKWMRAGYGDKTREFFAKKTNPKLLIDFAGVKIFESATVDTNILLFSRSTNRHNTICAVTNKRNKDSIKELSDFVKQQHSVCEFSSSNSWVILSPIEQSIKRKIESVGTPLKDWDIQIYRGVLTGYNEAFIISTEKREEILANCQSEDERKRTEELIRPILRGRDIKRYSYDWAELYLIATFPSRHYDIDEYPAVKQYFLSFAKDSLIEAGYKWVADNYLEDFCMQKLSQTGKFVTINGERITLTNSPEKARKKTSNKWFETQDSISYWDDFSKPKVMWKIIGCNINFCYDEKQMVCNNAVDIMVGDKSRLIQFVGFMNSKLFDWYLKLTTEAEVQGGGIQLYVTTLEKTLLKLDFPSALTDVIYRRMYNKSTEDIVDSAIFDAYKLTEEERTFIVNDRRVNRD